MRVLLDDQMSAVSKLKKYKVGALFMDTGTGKTGAACELIKSVPDIDYILWFTPFRTKQNLKDEILMCGGLQCDIVGIESISNSDRLYLELYEKLKSTKRSFVICDESLKIKNWKAKRTQRITRLGQLSKYRLILNGTPISRNMLDLWAQMEFLSPKILKMQIAEYKNTFCEYKTITNRANGYYRREFIVGYHNIDYLFAKIKPFIYECALEIEQKKIEYNESYTLTYKELAEYNKHKNELLEALANEEDYKFLGLTQKLQKSYSTAVEKLEKLDELIAGNDSGTVIVFCKYIHTRKLLTAMYPDVQILSINMHSYGLNLQQYNTTIFFDKVWDYAQRLQAENRTYRIGQKSDCSYYNLTADNIGLDNLIDRNIAKKTHLLDSFKTKSVEELETIL